MRPVRTHAQCAVPSPGDMIPMIREAAAGQRGIVWACASLHPLRRTTVAVVRARGRPGVLDAPAHPVNAFAPWEVNPCSQFATLRRPVARIGSDALAQCVISTAVVLVSSGARGGAEPVIILAVAVGGFDACAFVPWERSRSGGCDCRSVRHRVRRMRRLE